jgi:hypothetical protein
VWRVNKSMTIQELKAKMAVHLGKSESEFLLSSPPSKFGYVTEYKILTSTLRSNFIDNNARIVVRWGRALAQGEHRLGMYLFEPVYATADPVAEAKFVQLPDVFGMSGSTVAEFRASVLAVPEIACKITVPLDRVRLREKSYSGPGAVLLDTQVLERDFYLYTGKSFCIEQLAGAWV